MDHAEAHERIVDLALEPEGIDRLDVHRPEAAAPEDRPFIEHVRGCAACGADLAATRALRDRLAETLAEGRDPTAFEPISPPGWLRDAVLEAARREPRLTAVTPRPAAGPAETEASAEGPVRASLGRLFGRPTIRWAAGFAAVVAIALVGGLAGSALQQSRSEPGDPAMAAIVASLDRVLAAPDHRVASLTTPGGKTAGSVSWSATEFAVLTTSLAAPAPDRTYQCWLEWSGRWAAVGVMEFAGQTAYWTGSTGEWTTILAEPGTRFVVTLEPATGPGERPAGETVLEADLGA